MQAIHKRGLHGAVSCGSLTVSHSQLHFSNKYIHLGIPTGGLGGQHKQRLLGLSGVDPSSTKSSSGISTNAHRTAVSLHQRQSGCPDHLHHNQHSSHHHRQLRDDGSLKIIMLLSLSLTLLLLPWVSHHPEFLIAPLVLAVTPVVGNGVRPVLKEVAAGFVTTLRLMGMAAWFDITHELPPGQQQHHSHHHLPNGHHNHSSSTSHPQPQQQQQYGRDPYQQQQQQAYHMQQQPRPSGPHSPWPNPAYMPANWTPPPQQQQQPLGQPPSAVAGMSNPNGVMSHPISDEADVDWAPSTFPDPHRGDPNSLQHLREVLAADLQTETELGQQRGGSSSSSAVRGGSPRQRSPAGSPHNSPAGSFDAGASFDAGEFSAQQPQQSLPHMLEQQQQQLKQHSRDPRVLSKEAKQQLYQNHHSHLHQQQQQQQQSGGGGGGKGTN